MSTTTIRISTTTHHTLSILADQLGTPMSDVVDRAIELLRRHQLLAATNAAYAALRAQPAQVKELQEEDAFWDTTLDDGL